MDICRNKRCQYILYVPFQTDTTPEGVPNVKLYDKTGQKVHESSIWFPGAQRVIISSAAVTSDGRIIASGDAEKPDGTTATFIVLTDLAGKVTQVIQTKDYYPSHVCEAPDGTVWSFGGTGYDDQTNQPNPGDTLRHFDFHKGQIASYLPRSLFPDRPAPDKPGFIRCLKNEVVAYSRIAHQPNNSSRSIMAASPPEHIRQSLRQGSS
jgi:hypothetical protein